MKHAAGIELLSPCAAESPTSRTLAGKTYLLPNEVGKLRALALCSICAFGLTILFVGFPLLAFGIFTPLGLWYPASLGGAFLGLAVLLFLVSTHETRQLRRLANER